jgi:hypothetical protein
VRRKIAAVAAVINDVDAHGVGDLGRYLDQIELSRYLVDRIGQFVEAGIERLMLQWLDLDDIDGIETFAAKGQGTIQIHAADS